MFTCECVKLRIVTWRWQNQKLVNFDVDASACHCPNMIVNAAKRVFCPYPTKFRADRKRVKIYPSQSHREVCTMGTLTHYKRFETCVAAVDRGDNPALFVDHNVYVTCSNMVHNHFGINITIASKATWKYIFLGFTHFSQITRVCIRSISSMCYMYT